MEFLNGKNKDKKRKIKEDYDATSFFYDERYKIIQKAKYKMVLKDFKIDSKSILDAGCGTGLLFEEIRYISDFDFLKCQYIGVDISLGMLRNFKNKLRKDHIHIHRRVNLVLTDIENLPFRENVFKVIFCITSLQNLANIENGIQNLISVGMDDADLVISFLRKKLDKNMLIHLLENYTKKIEIQDIGDIEDVIITVKIGKKFITS